MTDTSAAAAQERAKEQLTTAMASMVTQGNIEAEQAAARKREEKRKAEEDAARKVWSCPAMGTASKQQAQGMFKRKFLLTLRGVQSKIGACI